MGAIFRVGGRCRATARRVTLAAVLALAACVTPVENFDRRATTLGLTATRLPGAGFGLRAYTAGVEPASDTLHVYIEHDGTPWIQGSFVADDPTPRTPFALELMAKDSGPRLFLGRPCYFEPRERNPRCDPLLWTQRRYAPEVVDSMVAALRAFLSAHPYRHIVLIGYSGGGTLAWLMAARIPETTRVVTIVANLDVTEWARIHDYTPLDGSLDPAQESPLAPAIEQRHYFGGRDTNVTPSVVASFARRHPEARVIEIAEFDHVCCWIERWPQLLADARGAAPAPAIGPAGGASPAHPWEMRAIRAGAVPP